MYHARSVLWTNIDKLILFVSSFVNRRKLHDANVGNNNVDWKKYNFCFPIDYFIAFPNE